MKIKVSKSQRAFDIFNVLFMIILSLIMIYPVWYVICASFSDGNRLLAHSGILTRSLGFSISAYKEVIKNEAIMNGYATTIKILVLGVSLNIILTSIGAYFLSQKNVYWQKLVMKLIVVTMFFSGGLIPTYLLVNKTLDLGDSILALILPNAINVYNLIIMRTSFMSIPDSLIESAKLDGASHVTILMKIVLPLSKAIIAVMVLYYAVGHWNAWFNASIYIRTRSKYPLQLVLREILIQNDVNSMSYDAGAANAYQIGETLKYAVIVVSTLPILVIYPFLQKYFTKGVMIGAVKG